MTNNPALVLDHDVADCPIADHELLTFTLDITKPKKLPITKTFRETKNSSPELFCELLLSESKTLNTIYNTDDVNAQVKVFNDVFLKCLVFCAPLVTRKLKRPFAPWLNEELRTLIQQKNNTLKAWKNDRNYVDLEYTYKNLKSQVRGSIHHFKSLHYNRKFNEHKSNSKMVWKVIKELIPNNKSSNMSDICNNEDNTRQTANAFNEFCANVGRKTFEETQLNNSSGLATTAPDEITEPNSLFRPEPIDWQTLVLTMAGMNSSGACGSDGIPLRFLNDSLPVIVFYLTTIMNTSIVTGIFPTAWKYAVVVPIFKTGDANDPSNYVTV